jgi:SAM-dependent methyltransferase
VRSLLDEGVDWTRTLSLGHRHGLTTRVAAELVDEAGVPSPVRTVLRRRAEREAARHGRLCGTLPGLLATLAEERVDAIPLRCARPSALAGELIELDLLVRRGAVPAASRALMARGLEPEVPLGALACTQVAIQSTRRFLDSRGLTVSLEWDVVDPATAHGAAVDHLWRRAVPAKLDGVSCLALDPPDLVGLAAVRGTFKRWQRLLWVVEMSEIMAETGLAAMHEALARATRSGTRRALALGVSLAGWLLDAPRSESLADAARAPEIRRLQRAIVADLDAPGRPLAGPSEIARFHLRARERMGDRLRYVIRRVTWPGEDDLPALPSPLGRALVPWRRAVRVGVDTLRRSRPYRGRQIARYLPTPPHVVDRMLALAGAGADDVLLDLGCGDGAVVARAATRLGCRGVGIELDATLVTAARRRVETAGVGHLVEVVHGDAAEMDLSPFTVVYVYLGATGNRVLREHLRQRLRPGTRLVSFNFDMGDWWPDDADVVDESPWGSNTLYLWEIRPPAAAAPDAAA